MQLLIFISGRKKKKWHFYSLVNQLLLQFCEIWGLIPPTPHLEYAYIWSELENILQFRWSIKQTVQSWNGTSLSSKNQICYRKLHICIISFTAFELHLMRLTHSPHHWLFLNCIVFPKPWDWFLMHTQYYGHQSIDEKTEKYYQA